MASAARASHHEEATFPTMTTTPTLRAGTPMTADDLMTLPKQDALYELVRGNLVVMTPAGARHGMIGVRLIVRLGAHVDAHALGVVLGPDSGFVLARDPDTVRAPDVSFVRASRVPAGGMPDGYFDGAPDLAVEVVSPSDTVYEVEEKVAEYLAAGARQVWVVNPKRRTVAVHAHGLVHVPGEQDFLEGGDVVPGFRCAIADVMR